MTYDPHADILLVEVSKRPIDYAEELGSVIVHFTKNHKPVALEILDASQFVTQATATSLSAKADKLKPLPR
jgi:uncharacterized protein YuzE